MPLVRKPGTVPDKQEPRAADLAATFAHGDAEARWAAARAAAQLAGGGDVLAAALPLETDPRVREAMLTSLARIGTVRSVAAIIPLLRTDDARIRTGALDALRAMPAAVRDFVPGLLADADSDVRILSCEIVRGLPGDAATAILAALLAHETEANVCAAAIDVLAEIGGPAALEALDALAARFPGHAFLGFACGVARDRILAQAADRHG